MDTFTNKKVLSIEETVKAIRDIELEKKRKELMCVGNMVTKISANDFERKEPKLFVHLSRTDRE